MTIDEISDDATLQDVQDFLPRLSAEELEVLKMKVNWCIECQRDGGNKSSMLTQLDATDLLQLKVAIINELAHKKASAA
jgi:hypothetical protein